MGQRLKCICMLAVIALSLTGCTFSKGKAASSPAEMLKLDSIWQASGYKIDEKIRGRIHRFLSIFSEFGYMPFYREVYRELYSQDGSFLEKYTAATALLLASHNLVNDKSYKVSGKRLFLHFCRKSLLDVDFATNLCELDRKFKIFSGNEQLEELWQLYIREIWARKVKPTIEQSGKKDEKQKKFLDTFPAFKIELSNAVHSSNDKEVTYDYFLIEGRSGAEEGDYELREVK